MFTTLEKPYNVRSRPKREKALKWANLAAAVVSFLCFAITAADVDQRAGRSVDNFWFPKDWDLDSGLKNILVNCSYTGTLSVEGWDVQYTMDEEGRGPMMAHSAALVRRAVWITGISVLLSALNKLFFDRNIHEYSLGDAGILSVRKGYLVVLDVGCVVWSIIALQQPNDESSYIDDYISNCTSFVSGASAPDHLWEAPPFILMFVGHGATLFMHMVSATMLLCNMSDNPQSLLRKQRRALLSIIAMRKSDSSGMVAETSFQLLSQVKTIISAEYLKEAQPDAFPEATYDNPLPPQQVQTQPHLQTFEYDQYESPGGYNTPVDNEEKR
eukprot:TRINITY_DN17348_c0_g2_i1.p1 TRINITY_DN17348_c0_g2~~TRINITY_DN17348_c0_g2_i1.p1  ORF type:complete len:345 (+),score=71.79 TRINITY_DN17348_c0_g2_i1:54-1037(+)